MSLSFLFKSDASDRNFLQMQMSGWYIFVQLEALEVVKNSTVKVIKALQTLARLCAQICSKIARHRSGLCPASSFPPTHRLERLTSILHEYHARLGIQQE